MRNQTVIRTLIREMINEIDRFKKEKGRDYDVLKDRGLDFEAMSKEEIVPGVPRYYFNMSSDFILKSKDEGRLKGGVKTTPMAIANPNAEYNTTPMGYYGYPLTVDFINKFKEQTLPYMQGSTLLTVVEAADPTGLMFLKEDAKIIQYAKFRREAFRIEDESGGKNHMPKTFTKTLLNNKTTWVYDPGNGEIHRGEPCQVVFLTSKAFKVVEKLDAKSVFESLTGGDARYRTDDDPFDVDQRIVQTLKHTKDPRVVAKLFNHPQARIRRLALMHPLAPKEVIGLEIDKLLKKMESLVTGDFEPHKFEMITSDLGQILKNNRGADEVRIYESLLNLVDNAPPDIKSLPILRYGAESIIEGLSKSKDESLLIRMLEDLAAGRIMIPKGLEASYHIDTTISKIADKNLTNETLISKYLDIVTGKNNSQYTFSVLLKIIDDVTNLTETLKAIKAFMTSKSAHSIGTNFARIHDILRGVEDDRKSGNLSPKEKKTFVETLNAIVDNRNSIRTSYELAKSILDKIKGEKNNA